MEQLPQDSQALTSPALAESPMVLGGGLKLSPLQCSILQAMLAYDKQPTKKELAEKLGISVACIYANTGSDAFRDAYTKVCLTAAGYRLHEVMEKNAEMAAEGDVQHAKLYLQMQGLLYDKTMDRRKPPESNTDDIGEIESRKKEVEKKLKAELKSEMNSAVNADFKEVEDNE